MPGCRFGEFRVYRTWGLKFRKASAILRLWGRREDYKTRVFGTLKVSMGGLGSKGFS